MIEGVIASQVINVIPRSNFISYWKFNNNGNDSVGLNNATTLAITYTAGLIDNCANLNGSSSKITIPDDNSLSFVNGTSDVDFSTIMLVKFDLLSNNPRLFIKVNSNNTDFEYISIPVNAKLRMALLDSSRNSKTTENTSSLSLSQWYVITTTYKASTKDLKVYIDNNVQNTDISSGGYTAMQNGTGDIHLGWDPRSDDGFNVLDGCINVFAFLNVELSSVQVEYVVNKLKVDNQHLI